MKFKKFRADNMAQAMEIIKDEIGPDAVIMSSKQVNKKKGILGLFSKKEFEVVAGYEEHKPVKTNFQSMLSQERLPTADYAGATATNDTELAGSLDELKGMIARLSERVDHAESPVEKRYSRNVMAIYRNLVKNDIGAGIAEEICAQTEAVVVNRKANAGDVAANLLKDMLGKPQPIEHTKYKQRVIMLVGPTGVGKTTTLVKLAYMLVYQEKLNVGVINTDSFRVAAQEHLKAYCEILQTDLLTVYKPDEISDAIKAFQDKDVILIDTAGKVSDDLGYRKDIEKIVGSGKIDDIYVTLSASTSTRVLEKTIENYKFLQKYNVIVTKIDETAYRGVFFYIAKMSGMPLSYVSIGQNVPDDIKVVDTAEIVKTVLGK
ncbi:flagellar biosynthesis protein FlhF [Christensenella tenuis]|uniref:Flagellar biosynthesis protein FlhF n=1 Tax=Christensenella tenuis TaxID=2763033 RepID=A0ABR7EAD4_9FIRM|nr:flagellar biosynthesis protein FlhF [Christensenella tenuis]MBC5646751.1 flagellar biosynthesis protein FlhF [Christensenella tenuis]